MGVMPAQDPGPGMPKPGKGELETHKVKPWKGKMTKGSLVPLEKEQHRRSVLGEVTKRMKDGHSKQNMESHGINDQLDETTP
jgi:hypothetical protein